MQWVEVCNVSICSTRLSTNFPGLACVVRAVETTKRSRLQIGSRPNFAAGALDGSPAPWFIKITYIIYETWMSTDIATSRGKRFRSICRLLPLHLSLRNVAKGFSPCRCLTFIGKLRKSKSVWKSSSYANSFSKLNRTASRPSSPSFHLKIRTYSMSPPRSLSTTQIYDSFAELCSHFYTMWKIKSCRWKSRKRICAMLWNGTRKLLVKIATGNSSKSMPKILALFIFAEHSINHCIICLIAQLSETKTK